MADKIGFIQQNREFLTDDWFVVYDGPVPQDLGPFVDAVVKVPDPFNVGDDSARKIAAFYRYETARVSDVHNVSEGETTVLRMVPVLPPSSSGPRHLVVVMSKDLEVQIRFVKGGQGQALADRENADTAGKSIIAGLEALGGVAKWVVIGGVAIIFLPELKAVFGGLLRGLKGGGGAAG